MFKSSKASSNKATPSIDLNALPEVDTSSTGASAKDKFKGAWEKLLTSFTCNGFYASLCTINNDMISQGKAVKTALNTLPDNVTSDELAKAMFTANMYLHFHNLGTKNPNLEEALKLFSPLRLVTKATFNPAHYLPTKNIFIENRTTQFTAKNSPFLSSKILTNQKLIEEANAKTNDMMSKLNNIANDVFAEDAFIPCAILVIGIAVVQTLPPIILGLLLYKSETVRKVLLGE
jgi:hypothetical protein